MSAEVTSKSINEEAGEDSSSSTSSSKNVVKKQKLSSIPNEASSFSAKNAKKPFGSPVKPLCAATYPGSPESYSKDCRAKCRDMLLRAIKSREMRKGYQDPLKMAVELEEAIYNIFNNTGRKYKIRMRSRIANLTNINNPKLHENFMSGAITPKTLARMGPEEMASDEMKTLREQYRQESFDRAQLTIFEGTTTGFYKCDKCKTNNCTHNEIQTRSSDEPMTIFVLCNECGHRWHA